MCLFRHNCYYSASDAVGGEQRSYLEMQWRLQVGILTDRGRHRQYTLEGGRFMNVRGSAQCGGV